MRNLAEVTALVPAAAEFDFRSFARSENAHTGTTDAIGRIFYIVALVSFAGHLIREP